MGSLGLLVYKVLGQEEEEEEHHAHAIYQVQLRASKMSEKGIIPGLPDEIAFECLVRLPFQFHSIVRSVCHDWRLLLSQPSFYRERRRLALSEQLLFFIHPLPTTNTTTCEEAENDHEKQQQQQQQQHAYGPPQFGLSIYNVTNQTWGRMTMKDQSEAPIAIPMFCQCVAPPGTGKLLLIGGWHPETLETVPDVYVIDLVGGKWRKGARMSTARSFFACAAVGGLVYVAGGHDSQKNALRSAEVYDLARDEWRGIRDMEEERDECQGISWEEDNLRGGDYTPRFWVVSGYGTDSQGQFRADAECFDPKTMTWTKIEGLWPFPRTSPRTTTVCGGSRRAWWWVDGEVGEVRGFDWDEQRWKPVKKIERGSRTRTWVSLGAGAGGEEGCGDGEDLALMMIESNSNGNKGGSVFLRSPFSAARVII
ncbi:hypothetical protein Dimus_000552 [Dionaea muscipula]